MNDVIEMLRKQASELKVQAIKLHNMSIVIAMRAEELEARENADATPDAPEQPATFGNAGGQGRC